MPRLIAALGYLLGSVPSSYIAGRIPKDEDIRRMGDENAGAANVFREFGRVSGIIVGIIDAGKGAAAVLIALAVGQSPLLVGFTHFLMTRSREVFQP